VPRRAHRRGPSAHQHQPDQHQQVRAGDRQNIEDPRHHGAVSARDGRAAQDAKFDACCASAQPPLSANQTRELACRLRGLEAEQDVRGIVRLLAAARGA